MLDIVQVRNKANLCTDPDEEAFMEKQCCKVITVFFYWDETRRQETRSRFQNPSDLYVGELSLRRFSRWFKKSMEDFFKTPFSGFGTPFPPSKKIYRYWRMH